MAAEASSEDDLLNPRNKSFYGGRKASKNGKGGVALNRDGSGELFDPWGNHYRVIMDTNRDDQITPPAWTGLKEPIKQSVIVWSPGPDGKDETADDNIASW